MGNEGMTLFKILFMPISLIFLITKRRNVRLFYGYDFSVHILCKKDLYVKNHTGCQWKFENEMKE